jgi:peptidyl-lysine (3S)-dioxygenase / protease
MVEPERKSPLSKPILELWVPKQIAIVDHISSLQFLRDYVSRNIPLVLRGACRHWPAFRKWNKSYLIEAVGNAPITVALTPDGRGDRILRDRFILPYEETMTLSGFFNLFGKRSSPVPYAQKQCDCLRDEYSMLVSDISELPVSDVFSSPPDAINLWIGDDRAVSSLHSDPYENLYAVVSGVKRFTLFPPTDLPYLYRRRVRQAQYDVAFHIHDTSPPTEIPWFQVDPDQPDFDAFPLFKHATPISVEIGAGDVLYLPALWYHSVAQTPGPDGATIAVNFWYDMQFDARYTWLRYQEAAVESALCNESAVVGRSLSPTTQ